MLCFVTSNAGKFAEIKSLIPDIQQAELELDELQELNPQKIIEHKLQQAHQLRDGELVVEDTSLCCDGLHGLPGPFVKWFLQSLSRDEVFEMVKNTGNTKATALTMLGYLDKEGQTHFFSGEVSGNIVSPRGEDGFGWDPLFQPEGSDKTFAEMGPAAKSKLSMRRLATDKLKKYLKNRGE